MGVYTSALNYMHHSRPGCHSDSPDAGDSFARRFLRFRAFDSPFLLRCTMDIMISERSGSMERLDRTSGNFCP
jgi:hypothetical protein